MEFGRNKQPEGASGHDQPRLHNLTSDGLAAAVAGGQPEELSSMPDRAAGDGPRYISDEPSVVHVPDRPSAGIGDELVSETQPERDYRPRAYATDRISPGGDMSILHDIPSDTGPSTKAGPVSPRHTFERIDGKPRDTGYEEMVTESCQQGHELFFDTFAGYHDPGHLNMDRVGQYLETAGIPADNVIVADKRQTGKIADTFQQVFNQPFPGCTDQHGTSAPIFNSGLVLHDPKDKKPEHTVHTEAEVVHQAAHLRHGGMSFMYEIKAVADGRIVPTTGFLKPTETGAYMGGAMEEAAAGLRYGDYIRQATDRHTGTIDPAKYGAAAVLPTVHGPLLIPHAYARNGTILGRSHGLQTPDIAVLPPAAFEMLADGEPGLLEAIMKVGLRDDSTDDLRRGLDDQFGPGLYDSLISCTEQPRGLALYAHDAVKALADRIHPGR